MTLLCVRTNLLFDMVPRPWRFDTLKLRPQDAPHLNYTLRHAHQLLVPLGQQTLQPTQPTHRQTHTDTHRHYAVAARILSKQAVAYGTELLC
jgi:hypothetical protein